MSDTQGPDETGEGLKNPSPLESEPTPVTPGASPGSSETAQPPVAPTPDPESTQAMSLAEIAEVQGDAAPPTDPAEPADAADAADPADLSTQAMTVAEIAEVADHSEPVVHSETVDPNELSTQAMTQQDVAAAKEPSARAEAATRATAEADDAIAPGEPTSALDSLFREDNFREPEAAVPLPVVPSFTRQQASPARSGSRAVAPAKRSSGHKALMIIAGILAAALILILLFLLGTRLGDQSMKNAASETTPTPTPTATATAEPGTGPVAAGDYDWDELRGGECLQPFDSAWDEEFTVVDCAEEHTAQLVKSGTLPEADSVSFPGVTALQTEVNAFCAAPDVLNYGLAGAVSDLQMSSSFPADEAAWSAGERGYYCFVDRVSGEPIPGDIAAAPAE
ncbi:MAG: hypothetical protein JWQ43_975 [Glaciihabitans sp.]|nr:hypothetical protein [Glaciihabitans sp.]